MTEKNIAAHIEALNQKISEQSSFIDRLITEVRKSIIGQDYMISRLLIGLLSDGHILLEGVPGLAKTLAIKSLSEAVNARFSRIQFTPDLLPADLIGTMIYNPGTHEFSIRKGPVFANFILADEINRSPAKVQSALLEAMQEKQVTIGDKTFTLEQPFLVLATQNPVEQEGTYPLPEAQMDRFMLKVILDYPSREEEREIIRMNLEGNGQAIRPVAEPEAILKARETVREIYLDPKIEDYILDLIFATRHPERFGLQSIRNYIRYGASPRASINLAKAAKALAYINHRGYVIPEDVQETAPDVLRHRIGITFEAEAEDITQDQIVSRILENIEIP